LSEYRASVVSLVGTVIDGRYQLLSVLGEGGMGAVYRAQQPDGNQVAVKMLHEELVEEQDQRERFEREARALFALQHPHVLQVHDFGIHQGVPYLVMELLEGTSLDQLVEEEGPLEPWRALHLAKQTARGLAFAHGKAVLHRDLKTENVFVCRTPQGEHAKLLDFGLVKFVDDDRWGESKKLTVTGSVFGTPAYMSPEQCAGAPADAKSDVYSMGVILFELFTGIWPFMEETRMKMFQAHLTKPVPKLDATRAELLEAPQPPLPPQLDAIIEKAMAKRAADRFEDAGQLLEALEQVQIEAPAQPLAHPTAQPLAHPAAQPLAPPAAHALAAPMASPLAQPPMAHVPTEVDTASGGFPLVLALAVGGTLALLTLVAVVFFFFL